MIDIYDRNPLRRNLSGYLKTKSLFSQGIDIVDRFNSKYNSFKTNQENILRFLPFCVAARLLRTFSCQRFNSV